MHFRLNELVVTYRDVASLKPYAHNSRLHTRAQVKLLASSMLTYGWTNPILIDEDGNVLAGHARLEAAIFLGMTQVPTIRLSHMTAAQKRAYIIADNRMIEVTGGWDRNILALEHQAIRLMDPEFDITSTGFSLDDVEIIIDGLALASENEPGLPNREHAPVARVGDVWILGNHRLCCGIALKSSTFEALLGHDRAQLVIADAPYNVRINGNVSNSGKHREFAMGSGEMSKAEFATFLTTAFANLIAFSRDGSIQFSLWAGAIGLRWMRLRPSTPRSKTLFAGTSSQRAWGPSTDPSTN